MPKREDSNNKFDPMHRIVGAVILVTLTVLIVPMVLREQVPPEKNADVMPAPSEKVTKVVIMPVESPKPRVQLDEPDSNHEQDRHELTHNAPTAPVLTEPAPAVSTSTSTTPVQPKSPTNSAPPKSATIIDKGWVIQLGTYANPDNASRVQTQLKQLGYVVTLEDIQLTTGKATRVRVGPYTKKTQAITTKADLQKQIGLKGVVLAYP